MDLIRKLYVKADGFARGQTMAEYALILAAVAVVVYAGYQHHGHYYQHAGWPTWMASSRRAAR